MGKIQRFNNFQNFFPFFIKEGLRLRCQQFLKTSLGKIYTAIPFQEIANILGLKESKKGPTSIFPPKGQIALMILKSYSNMSDNRLIECLNGNIDWQFFCGIKLAAHQQITNYKIVSQIRCDIAVRLEEKFQEVQKMLAIYWKDFIQKKEQVLLDATVYEVALRYPTDIKLLWESIEWIYKNVKKLCKMLGLKLLRTKYKKWEKRTSSYFKKRKKTKKEGKILKRYLLKLLKKLNKELDDIEKTIVTRLLSSFTTQHNDVQGLQKHFAENKKALFQHIHKNKYERRRETIQKIYDQQNHLFLTGEHPKGRILSIPQAHLRPIKRGKETKKIEIGLKVNKIQVDSINFIEKMSFENFNESSNLIPSIELAESLIKQPIEKVGADNIYATNANRRELSKRRIEHGFPQKGPKAKDASKRKKKASAINKERSTVLEGSFGVEKESYGLKRINVRTPQTQKLHVFFGIHTKNALEIGRRMAIPP